eukprot:SAG11_NODE_1034_length_6091_cov_6.237984_5_plen_91_part_00
MRWGWLPMRCDVRGEARSSLVGRNTPLAGESVKGWGWGEPAPAWDAAAAGGGGGGRKERRSYKLIPNGLPFVKSKNQKQNSETFSDPNVL